MTFSIVAADPAAGDWEWRSRRSSWRLGRSFRGPGRGRATSRGRCATMSSSMSHWFVRSETSLRRPIRKRYSVSNLASCSLITYPTLQANPAASAATKMTTAAISRTERGRGGRSSASGAGRNTNSAEDAPGPAGGTNSNTSGSSWGSLRARRRGAAATHRIAAAIETETRRRMKTPTASSVDPRLLVKG
jgi:hypothetical protein